MGRSWSPAPTTTTRRRAGTLTSSRSRSHFGPSSRRRSENRLPRSCSPARTGARTAWTPRSTTCSAARSVAPAFTGYDHRCRRRGCGYSKEEPGNDPGRCPECNMRLWAKPLPRHVRFHDLREPRHRRRRPRLGQDLQVLRHRPRRGAQRRGEPHPHAGVPPPPRTPGGYPAGSHLGPIPQLHPPHVVEGSGPVHQRAVPAKPAAVRALPARMVELGLQAPIRSAG